MSDSAQDALADIAVRLLIPFEMLVLSVSVERVTDSASANSGFQRAASRMEQDLSVVPERDAAPEKANSAVTFDGAGSGSSAPAGEPAEVPVSEQKAEHGRNPFRLSVKTLLMAFRLSGKEMNMKQQLWKAAGGLLCVLSILYGAIGCAQPPEKTPETAVDYQYDDGHLRAELGEKLIVDAYVREPAVQDAAILHAALKQIDCSWEEASRILLGEEELEFREATPPISEMNTALTADREGQVFMFIPGWHFYWHTHAKSGKWYNTAIQQWVFEEASQREGLYRYPVTVPGVSAEAELEGLSKSEAITILKEKLDVLKLPLSEEPTCVLALDLPALENMREKWNTKSGVTDNSPAFMQEFVKEDEAYYILWDYSYEGIALLSGNIDVGDSHNLVRRQWAERGATLMAVVSRQGVEYVESYQNLYDVEKKEEPAEILSIEEVLHLLPMYYERVLLEEERTVQHLSLCYVPVPVTLSLDDHTKSKIDLVPCWVAEARYERNGHQFWEFCYINALTGEFLPVNP